MHIAKIRIENVKGFGEGEEAVDLDLTEGGKRTDLSGWWVVAGPNGSGKTTFLQAAAFCLADPGAPVRIRSSLPWTRRGAERSNTDVFLSRDERDDPLEEASGSQLKVDVQWSSHDQVFGTDLVQKPATQLENQRGWFLACYGPARRFVGNIEETLPPRLAAMAGIARLDGFLAESVVWLKDLEFRRLKGDEKAGELLQWAKDLVADDLLPEKVKIVDVGPDGLKISHQGKELTIYSFADGYRTTMAFAFDLVMRMAMLFQENLRFDYADGRPLIKNTGVVLVDEMELHLHPSWQQRIGFWLKAHFPKIQFIVTTHSPFICQAADALIRLSPPGTGRPAAEILGEDTFKQVVGGGADDAVVSELFGLPHAHSAPIEEQRDRLANLEAREFRGILTEEERGELLSLQKKLPYVPGSSVERVLRKVVAAR